ncbi:MAG TPA: aldehyde ferredoxin oxidoreductase C-terminal domain-containing protein [Planctomycetota bacterium]|jgi:aldehyde:ferredoxin oxidoreductase|nr:aldehyde ferredoxin oxidoreductase C-terminal domain-containing protein [Planctomycetota bacterium]
MRGRTIVGVDLSRGVVERDDLPGYLARDFCGGSGVNSRLLYDLAPRVEPLSPANPLLLGVGPMVAAGVPSAARVTFTSTSPLSGFFCDSNAGGSLGLRLAGAGIDHLLLTGRAPLPSCVVVGREGEVDVIATPDLWGLPPEETDARLAERFGDCETARIGLAGERGVRFAGIVSGRRRPSLSGRGGLGAVMGSKNLKGIVVRAPVPRREADADSCRNLVAALLESPRLQMRAQRGTLDLLHAYAAMGDLRERNFERAVPAETVEAFDPDAIHEEHAEGRKGCTGCPTPCGFLYGGVDLTKARRAEFGAVYALGPNLGVSDFAGVLRLLEAADRYALDAIELGTTLATYASALDRGERGGDPIWGDVPRLLALVDSLGRIEGPGAPLADGAAAFARSIGRPELAPHSKGLGVRPEKNLASVLGQCVSTRGGDHMRAFPFLLFGGGNRAAIERVFGPLPEQGYDPTLPAAKGRLVWWHENFKTAIDAAGFCAFSAAALVADGLLSPGDLAGLMPDGDGSWEGFFAAGERTVQLQRAFNARRGASRADDLPPWAATDLERDGMLEEYYRWRGLSADGRPTFARLASLALDDVALELRERRVLGEGGSPYSGPPSPSPLLA